MANQLKRSDSRLRAFFPINAWGSSANSLFYRVGTFVIVVALVTGTFAPMALSQHAMFELERQRDPDLLLYGFVETHSHDWSGVDDPVPGAMKVLQPARIPGQHALVVYARNPERLSFNPAAISLMDARQWQTIDEDPIYGQITGFVFFNEDSPSQTGVIAGLKRNDSAFVVRAYPGMDSVDLLYLSHGIDVNGSGHWDGGAFPCLIDDYDYDGVEEIFVYLAVGRDLEPRSLFCVDPETMSVEWQMPMAGGLSWGSLYSTGDSLKPELMLVTYNYKNGVSDEYFDDMYCYLARVNGQGRPEFRAVIGYQHGARGLWPATRSGEYLLFHTLPIASPDSLDDLPEERYQLSIIDRDCRPRLTIDIPSRLSDVWTADYDGDGRDDLYTLSSTGAIRIYKSNLNLLAECPRSNLVRRLATLRVSGQNEPVYLFSTSDGMWMYSHRFLPLAYSHHDVQEMYSLALDSLGNTTELLLVQTSGSHAVIVQDRDLSVYLSVLFWRYRDTIIIVLTLLVLALVFVNARRQAATRKMLASERRLRSVFDNASEGFYRADLQGSLIWVSPAAAKLVGIDDPEKAKGLNLRDYYVNPADRDRLVSELMEKGRVHDYQVWMRRTDGTKVLVSANSYKYFDHKGRLAGVEGVVRDITETKKAEEALAASEARYRGLLANLPVGVYRARADGQVLSVSPGAVAMYGFDSEDDMLHRNGNEAYVDPGVRDNMLSMLQEHGELRDFEVQVRKKDGTAFWVSSTMRAITNSDGEMLYFDGIDMDVTERKAAEGALRVSEEKYRLVVENVRATITIVSYDGVVIFANEHAVSQLRMKPEEVIGKSHWDLFPRETADRQVGNIRKVIETGKELVIASEIPILGEIRHYYSNLQPYRDPAGRITAALVVAHDITDLREAELQAQKLSHALRQAIDGIAICSNEGVYEYVNEAWAMMHGFKVEELIGQHLSVNHTPHQMTHEVQPFWQTLRQRGAHSGEVGHATKDGREFPSFMSVTILKDKDGRATGMVGTVRDITEQKHAQLLLKDSEEKFRSLAEHSLQGIYFSQDDRIEFVNPRFAEIIGIPKEELIGEDPRNLVRRLMIDEHQINERLTSYEARRAGAEKTFHQILKIRTPAGVIRWTETLSHVFYLRGKIAMQGVVADITDERQALESLQQSESRYRQLVESAREAIFSLDRHGRLLFANSIAAGLAERSADDLVGRSIWDVIPESDTQESRQAVRTAFEESKAGFVDSVITVRGERRFYRTTLQPITDDQQVVSSVLGVSRDVTDTVRFQEELRRERDFIRSLLDTANGLVVCLDSEARITIFNTECEKVTGYRREEVMGRRWPDLFLPKEHHHEGLKDFAAWVRRHPHDVYEGPLYTKSGEIRTVLWSNTALIQPDGSVTAIAVGQDITDRIRAERALKESEEFNRVVLERSPLGISVRSRTGKLLSHNAAWREIWQVSDEDLDDYRKRERYALQFDHRDSYLGEWLPKVREIYERGGYLRIPEVYARKPHTRWERWLSQHFYAIRDIRGHVDRVVIITEDITQRKLAEAEAQAANKAKIEQARSIAGGFAHEIRNALFPAEGAIYRLSELDRSRDPDRTKCHSYTMAAAEAIGRAIDITELISHYTKVDSEREPEVVDLSETLREVLSANDIRLRDQGVKVEVDVPSDGTFVVANGHQLYSVINNILLNSLDALTKRPEPTIFIVVSRNLDDTTLTLRDNGQGIPRKDLDRIFDAFFSSKPDRGTGLGLALAKKIVEMYEGRIAVCSEEGQWTETTIELKSSMAPLNNERSGDSDSK